MPPMLDVALAELVGRRPEEMLAEQARLGVQQAPSRPAIGRGIRKPRPTGRSRSGPRSGRPDVWYSSQPLARKLSEGSGVSTFTAPRVCVQYCHTPPRRSGSRRPGETAGSGCELPKRSSEPEANNHFALGPWARSKATCTAAQGSSPAPIFRKGGCASGRRGLRDCRFGR